MANDMEPAVEKAAIAQALEQSFESFCKTLSLLTPDERERPGLGGGWSAKVHVAHVGFWDDYQRRRMEAAVAGTSVHSYPYPEGDNDSRALADAGRPWDEVFAQARQARAELVAFARNLPDEAITQDYIQRGKPFSVHHMIGHMAGHVREHNAPIRQFCGSMERWSREGLRTYVTDAHAALLEAGRGVDGAARATVPVCGNWTTRDVLAHVMSWNQHAEQLWIGWPEPDPATTAEWPDDMEMDALNDRLMAARAHLGWEEMLEELARLHAHKLALFDGLTTAELSAEGYTWRGRQPISVQFFEVALHEREHTNDILQGVVGHDRA